MTQTRAQESLGGQYNSNGDEMPTQVHAYAYVVPSVLPFLPACLPVPLAQLTALLTSG